MRGEGGGDEGCKQCYKQTRCKQTLCCVPEFNLSYYLDGVYLTFTCAIMAPGERLRERRKERWRQRGRGREEETREGEEKSERERVHKDGKSDLMRERNARKGR